MVSSVDSLISLRVVHIKIFKKDLYLRTEGETVSIEKRKLYRILKENNLVFFFSRSLTVTWHGRGMVS